MQEFEQYMQKIKLSKRRVEKKQENMSHTFVSGWIIAMPSRHETWLLFGHCWYIGY